MSCSRSGVHRWLAGGPEGGNAWREKIRDEGKKEEVEEGRRAPVGELVSAQTNLLRIGYYRAAMVPKNSRFR